MKLTNDFQANIKQIEEAIGWKKSYDVGLREIKVFEKRVNIYFLTGMVDSLQLIEVVRSLLAIPREKPYSFALILDNLGHHSVTILEEFADVIFDVLNGMMVIICEDSRQAISVDVRSYPSRSIAEPDMEKVIRGAHDGFNENFHLNVQLLRRRVKDVRLRNEIFRVGDGSPAYVCLSYLEGVCDAQLVSSLQNSLKNVQVEHLIMADKALEEILIRRRKLNPYPLVRYTERADTVAVHLYQGMFAIFVDTSPSVILGPCTFFDHLMHLEEYRQTPTSGTYLRLIRFLGIFLSLFLTPVWIILIKNNYLVGPLEILTPGAEVKVNIYLQIIAAEIGVEFLRLASIHTPNSLSTSMSLIAGFLLGDFAVNVGLFSIQTVLLVAISAIGTYLTPSYELGLANKISKIVFILAIIVFDWYGFALAVLLWIIYLSLLKSFGKPYLYPLLPFNPKRLVKVFLRFPFTDSRKAKNK
jgi:stage V sporulation protein AF